MTDISENIRPMIVVTIVKVYAQGFSVQSPQNTTNSKSPIMIITAPITANSAPKPGMAAAIAPTASIDAPPTNNANPPSKFNTASIVTPIGLVLCDG